jgi:hypothetical protein
VSRTVDAPASSEQAGAPVAGQTVGGIEAGLNTFVTAAAIAYGLMVSAVVLPQRLTQLTPRRG